MEPFSPPCIKVVVLGEAGVGKTTLVRSLWTDFDERYIATIGVEVSTFQFLSNHGKFELSVWDMAGQDRLSGLRDEYVVGAQGAIIVTEAMHGQIEPWVRLVRGMAGQVPIVVAASKFDTVMLLIDA